MAQGEFTKQEADFATETTEKMFEGIPKTRRGEYLGHLNDILLFIAAAKKEAPDKPELDKLK